MEEIGISVEKTQVRGKGERASCEGGGEAKSRGERRRGRRFGLFFPLPRLGKEAAER